MSDTITAERNITIGKKLGPCQTCYGDGSIETGRTEYETGAPITVECQDCEGSGLVMVEVELCNCCQLPLDGDIADGPECRCDHDEICNDCRCCSKHCACGDAPWEFQGEY